MPAGSARGGGVEVLIETRGEGGYTVAAPSAGSVHPSGGRYRLVEGGVDSIAEISADERDTLFALARMLDEMPRRPVEPAAPVSDGSRPGDRFNAETSWGDLLPRYGWVRVSQCGEETFWRRPGKVAGISASTNYKGSGVLKVFSTSTTLDTESTYSPFAFHAMMEHDGDFAAAARTLAAEYSAGDGVVKSAATLAAVEAMPASAFPLHVLPPPIRAYVEAAAASLPVPPEMVGVPLIGFAGALIGNRLHVVVKESWHEYPALFLAVVAAPGTAKTPALKFAQWPLDALQDEAMHTYRQHRAEYQDAWLHNHAKKPTDRTADPIEPKLRHYFTTDITLEALMDMLARTPGVAVTRDEISGWVTSMDMYRARGSDRQQYLSLWASQNIKVDRKREAPIYRRAPVVAVIGGIQPDLAGTLHTTDQSRDGFVERILPIVPDVQPQLWTDATISSELFRDALAVFEELDRLPMVDDGGGEYSGGNGVGTPVRLNHDARQLFKGWFNENQAAIACASGLEAGFYSKLPAHVARLALILHALWNAGDPRPMISAATMAHAIELGEFFRAHIGRFLALICGAAGTQLSTLGTRILRILRTAKERDSEGWVPRTHVSSGLGSKVNADQLTGERDSLERAEEIERRSVPTATKPREEWRLRAA